MRRNKALCLILLVIHLSEWVDVVGALERTGKVGSRRGAARDLSEIELR